MALARHALLRPPALACALAVALAAVPGCAQRGEPGPLFGSEGVHPREPRAGSGILYIHRVDAVRTSGRARLRLAGRLDATLLDREYLYVDLPAGRYELSLQFRGLPWAWGWDTLPFEVRPGQVRFLRLRAMPVRTPRGPGPLADDTGSGNERLGVELTRGFVEADVALPELRTCRRSPQLEGRAAAGAAR